MIDTATAPRYAVYYTPDPKSELWRFGSAVIGYDAQRGFDVPFAMPGGYDIATWARITEEPRRYGFHATLKAPFHLAGEACEADLLAAVDDLARGIRPIDPLALDVTTLGRFVAMTIAGDEGAVRLLADAVVTGLEPFRAQISADDRARRSRARLTDRQRIYLDRYGYPYVRDEYRFHMTLTGKLEPKVLTRVRDDLAAARFAAVPSAAVAFDALSVLRQDRRDGRFRIIERFALAPAR